MKKRMVGAFAFAVASANAQLDRAGNVIENESSGGVSSEGMFAIIGGIVIGAIVGAIYGYYKNANSQEKISINGCIVLGGMAGMFAVPLFAIIFK